MNVIPLPPPATEMPIIKAVAVVALWETGRFRSDEIAVALSIRESDVERILHVKREAER